MHDTLPLNTDSDRPELLPGDAAAEHRIRVLVVEDHAMVREGLIALLRQASDFEVCAGASESKQALDFARTMQPDVVVLDMFLEDHRDGIGLISDLRGLHPRPRILIISMHREEDIAERVARAGAHGFVNKAETTEALIDAVRAIAAGRSGFSRRVAARFLNTMVGTEADDLVRPLTAREIQVFRLIGAGLGLSEIAARLNLSAKTVASHRENLKNKLTCHTAGELAARARWWLGIT